VLSNESAEISSRVHTRQEVEDTWSVAVFRAIQKVRQYGLVLVLPRIVCVEYSPDANLVVLRSDVVVLKQRADALKLFAPVSHSSIPTARSPPSVAETAIARQQICERRRGLHVGIAASCQVDIDAN
jgi:hypothetical protein